MSYVSKIYKPVHISEEALICLECTQTNCKGDCERFKKEKNKLLKTIKKIKKL